MKKDSLKTFDVFAISFGDFSVNKEFSRTTQSFVRFNFTRRNLNYDFIVDCGDVRYNVGFSISFNSIRAIYFYKRKEIYLRLLEPAKREYCNCEKINGNSFVIESCDDFDITNGHCSTSFLHAVFLKRDQTLTWIRELLKADREFFEPIIVRITKKLKGMSIIDYINSHTISIGDKYCVDFNASPISEESLSNNEVYDLNKQEVLDENNLGWQNLGDNDLVLADNINIASNSLIHVQKINQMSSVDYINCGETITFYDLDTHENFMENEHCMIQSGWQGISNEYIATNNPRDSNELIHYQHNC